ncbi:hypothetical protein ACHAWU_003004 [Discostella pseudostelligera]|uniref:SAP domain-containing protein n=1 Tax=Discostella pseudostelligera TaxID=259834 RepID=A0ABD3M7R2_9STRA
MSEALPNISSMKLTQLREELNLYGINSSTFCEKSEMITALQHARDTLPRPTTSYREVEPPTPQPQPPPPAPSKEEEEKKRFRATRRNSITKPSPFSTPSSSSGGSAHSTMPQAATATATSSTATNSHPPPPPQAAPSTSSSSTTTTQKDAKKALALRSPVVIHQRIKEKPTSTITTPSSFATPTTIGERTNSFLPGSPFSFAIHGSIYDDDAAIIRIPDGTCLTINSASVDAKSMEHYLHQKGALGVSLKLSSEENPQLLPLWTFDKEKSSSYNISNLGIRVAGPRNIRLGACMEMGYRSGASVDVFVFGSVTLDSDKY